MNENTFRGSNSITFVRPPFSVVGIILKNLLLKKQPGPEVIKLFFMLNSAEHEILPAHKC